MNRRDFLILTSIASVSSLSGSSFSLNQIKKQNLFENENMVKYRANHFMKRKIPKIIVKDRDAQNFLEDIARPLFATSNRKVDWKIFLVNEGGWAYTVGAGLIVIDIRLIKLCTSQIELASVIAHEIGHNKYKNIEQRYTTDKIFKNLNLNLDKITVDILSKAFSKHHEREADAFIIKAFLETGYDINKASSFFHKLQKISPDDISIDHCLHSTHPLKKDRIQILEKVASTFSQDIYLSQDSMEFEYLKSLT